MKRLVALLFFVVGTVTGQTPLLNNYGAELFNDFHNEPVDLEVRGDLMVVAERAGVFWLYNRINGNWVRESVPLLDISERVTTDGERGVQSILLSSHYLHIYYTVEEDYYFNSTMPETSVTVNRISRFEVSWNQNLTVFGEKIIVDGIPSLASNHQGGGMAWGPEGTGTIYVGIGDGSYDATMIVDAVTLGVIPPEHSDIWSGYRSQTLSSPNGKVLKILGWNGKGHHLNPYYDPLNPSTWESRIYDYGYRNPYEIATDLNGEPIVADVGQSDNEELTVPIPDGNAGWGAHEGFGTNFWDSDILNPDTGQPFTVDYNNPPVLDYSHNPPQTRIASEGSWIVDDNNPISGSAIIGGTFIQGDLFGEALNGAYLFTDYLKGWINIAYRGGDTFFSHTETLFGAGDFFTPVDITQDPTDGSIYIVSKFGDIVRVYYDNTLTSPTYNFPFELASVVGYYDLNSKFVTDPSYLSDGVYITKYQFRGNFKYKKSLVKDGKNISDGR